jgi:cell division transport system ATP-binding protein
MNKIESSIITIDKVSKRYNPDNLALENITIEVGKGEFIFLTGPSGSGKSTLLKLLFCAERPTSGNIWVDGMDLSSLSRGQIPFLRRKVGVVFQDFKLLPEHSVFDNVSICLEVTGLKKEQVEQRVKEVIDGVGLKDKMYQKAIQLSGGEQQRVAIARAVINRPAIILADEPTGNLDRERTDEVMALMEELNARGTTIIFATHDERLFGSTHRRVLRLLNGRLEEPV